MGLKGNAPPRKRQKPSEKKREYDNRFRVDLIKNQGADKAFTILFGRVTVDSN